MMVDGAPVRCLEQLRVPVEAMAGEVQGRLVEGRGHDDLDLAREGEIHRPPHVAVGGVPAPRALHAVSNRVGLGGLDIDYVKLGQFETGDARGPFEGPAVRR